jgi:hypothetical protein
MLFISINNLSIFCLSLKFEIHLKIVEIVEILLIIIAFYFTCNVLSEMKIM